MADITLKLVWYRLGESASNLVDRYDRFLEWYSAFSWRRVDILDMLFLGWLLAAFLVVGCINIYLKFFRRKDHVPGFGGLGFGSTGETCQWINSAIGWLFLHSEKTPVFIDCWLQALNEHLKKHNNDVQLKFDRIQAGSLPPKFTQVNSRQGPPDTLTVCVGVECADVSLLVTSLQQHPQQHQQHIQQSLGGASKPYNCDIILQRLYGQLQVISQHGKDTISIQASFPTPPEVQIQVRQRSFETQVDPRRLEAAVKDAISGAVTLLCVSPQLNVTGSAYGTRADGTMMQNSITPLALKNRRLLVKIIKASGLGEKESGSTDSYCVVHLNEPIQKHTTSVAKGTANPFWDEHFLFDLEDHSQQLKFEIFDREKPPGSDFLGHATVLMAELKRTPSSRQILPLISQKSGNTRASLTVEFLFVDPADSQHIASGARNLGGDLSPRRRIDTNRTITPSGATITTTTTTTDRRRPSPHDSAYSSDSPQRVEKTDSSYNSNSYSPYNNRSSNPGNVNAHAAALMPGSQTLPRNKVTANSRSSTMPVPAAAQANANYFNTPVIQTTDSSGLDDVQQQQYSPSMASADSYEQRRELYDALIADMKKSKSFASAIKKRFTRGPKKPRSHSADRASSLRGEPQHLLKPPTQGDANKTTDDLEQTDIPDGAIRKSRSHSFSSSMKKLFGKKKKGQSRESSVSRLSSHRYGDTSRDISTAQASPDIAYRDTPGMPLSHPAHSSTTPTGGDYSRDYSMYSTSVPPQQSPLYDH